MSSNCNACNASFGLKFDNLTCSFCGRLFCAGHLISNEDFVLNNASADFSGSGICFDCLFKQWNIDEKANGFMDRWIKRPFNKLISYVSNQPKPTEQIKISHTSLVKINRNIAWSIFMHQQEITLEDVFQNARSYAKLVSVNRGRNNERDVSLNDLYKFIDWIKSHPNLPDWIHDITWHKLESVQGGAGYVMDIWHVFFAAVASNPVTAIYHVGDRIVEQQTGKGLFTHVYQKTKNGMGLNINIRMAIIYYLAGCFIFKFYDVGEHVN